ncbi:DoxX family protein [Candidatus Woesearchaeota archaeon]|nr:DoxX family protein [Candidatus Woesearchaeota archaeon]
MAYEILFLIGRVIVGLYFIMNGFNHFAKMKMMVGYAKSKNVPLAKLAVPATGLLLLLGGLSFLLGYYPQIGVLLIAVFLIPVSFIMHNFWAVPPEQKMVEMVNFMKNMALLGSALMFLAISTPWAFSL